MMSGWVEVSVDGRWSMINLYDTVVLSCCRVVVLSCCHVVVLSCCAVVVLCCCGIVVVLADEVDEVDEDMREQDADTR